MYSDGDLEKLFLYHKKLAKDLMCEKSVRWNDLFKELGGIPGKGGYLTQHYEKRLQDECCGSSVEDFCQHLHHKSCFASVNNFLAFFITVLFDHCLFPFCFVE